MSAAGTHHPHHPQPDPHTSAEPPGAAPHDDHLHGREPSGAATHAAHSDHGDGSARTDHADHTDHVGHAGHPGRAEHAEHAEHTELDHAEHADHVGHGHGSAPEGHTGHGGHAGHAGHMGHGDHAAQFRDRFWWSLLLAVPVVAFSPMFADLLGYGVPAGTGWVSPVLGTIVFTYGGWPFLTGAVAEIRARQPGMMLLVGLAITVAFAASLATSLHIGGVDLDFWWELALLVVIMLLGHWLEMRALGQASSALDALAALLPDDAERVGGDGVSEAASEASIVGSSSDRGAERRMPPGYRVENVPLTELAPGDVVLVRPGGRVPADGVVVDGEADIDESMVTGESRPVGKGPGDRVVAGTVALDSAIRVQVTAVGEQTALAGIRRLVEQAQTSRSRAQALADRAAAALFYFASAAGAVTFATWMALGQPKDAVERTVTVLVIACPHALGLAIPLVIAIATAVSARTGILVKDRLALERMRTVDAVLFDKTGTLTKGRPAVVGVAVVDPDGEDGGGTYGTYGSDGTYGTYSSDGSDGSDGSSDGGGGGDGGEGVLPDIDGATEALARLLRLAAAAESDSEHPLARAIVDAARRYGDIPAAEDFRALAGRGVQATVIEAAATTEAASDANVVGSRTQQIARSAPDRLGPPSDRETERRRSPGKPGNTAVASDVGVPVAVGGPALLREAGVAAGQLPETVERAVEAWADQGATIVYVLVGGTVAGAVALADEIRPESKDAVDALHARGIHVVMVTGDARHVAEAVGRRLGVDEVFAEVLPEDKDSKVEELQRRGLTVAMVGDGVNDAPALARADVGIAIGAGTDVAIESAGVVLASDDPRGVVSVITLSQGGYRKMVQNLAWATGYNLLAVPLAGGVLAPVGVVLPPAVAAILMSASTLVVAANAQLLRKLDLRPAPAPHPGGA